MGHNVLQIGSEPIQPGIVVRPVAATDAFSVEMTADGDDTQNVTKESNP